MNKSNFLQSSSNSTEFIIRDNHISSFLNYQTSIHNLGCPNSILVPNTFLEHKEIFSHLLINKVSYQKAYMFSNNNIVNTIGYKLLFPLLIFSIENFLDAFNSLISLK